MEFLIKPYIGINNILLGDSRANITNIIKEERNSFKRNEFDSGVTDHYENKGLFLIYDVNEKLEAIEFEKEAKVVFKQRVLFEMSPQEILDWIVELDENITIEEDGFTSEKFGIGGYLGAGINNPDEESLDSIIIFKKGYYDFDDLPPL